MSWLGKMSWPGAKKQPQAAKLGENLGMYYNEELKRWVEPGKEDDLRKEAEDSAAPPKGGPASGPAGYNVERRSIENRYVQTPGFGSKDGGRDAPQGIGSLVPKRADAPRANLFVPPAPAAPAGAEDERESVGSGPEGGIAGGDEESEGSTGGPVAGSETGRDGHRTGDTGMGPIESLGGEVHLGAFGGQRGGAPSTFLDYQGMTSETEPLTRGSGLGAVISEAMVDPETGEELGGAGGMGGDGLWEETTFDAVNQMISEQNELGTAGEAHGEAGEDQENGEAVSEFAWIYAGWSDETWQEFYAWLDEQYGRDDWTSWTPENWNGFWKWWVSVNYPDQEVAGYEGMAEGGEGGEEGRGEGEDAGLVAAVSSDMERKHSVENPRELLNRAFGQGKEEGGGIAQAEGVLAGAGQPVDGPGGAAALDVPGLSLPAVSVSLEGGQGGESAEKWSRGAGPTSGMFLDVNTTPKVDSSPLGLYDGDRERLKAGSKLTGPLPWDDDADMDDEAGSPQAQHSQISSLAAACEQEDGQHVDAVAARTLAPLSIGDHPSSMEAAPLGSSHGVGMETGKSAGSRADLDKDASEAPSSRKRAEETTASGPAQEPDVLGLRVHDNQRDDSAREMSGLPLRKEQFEKSAIEVDATPQQPQGVLGITLEDDQFAAEHHAAISLPGGAEATIREEDHSVHQSAQQRGLEDTNGKLHPGPLPKNGYTMNLDGIDMGAMLLDIQELLGYVDSSDSKIAERKSLSQAQLARIIQALKLGEPVSMKVASAPVGQQTHREQTEGDQVALAPDRSVAVEELTEKLQQCEEKLNDAALAIGMQTRKVVALKQHCEAHGVAADAVVEEIEAMYYSKKDSSLVEDTEVASPWDQGGAADASFPAVTVKSHQASYSPSHCLPESDPHDFLGVAPSHDSHRQIDGMI